jgi:hypothetical protein
MPGGDGQPSLGDLLSLVGSQETAKVRGPAPATVVSYDRTTQTCDARLLVWPQGGVAPPDIRQVPVLFPRGAGVSITWELSPGDEILLVPCEADTSAWFARGVSGQAPTARKSSFADAFAIPGIGSAVTKLGAAALAANALVVTCDDVRLGSSAAADFVALAGKVLQELQDIKACFDNHKHDAGGYTWGGNPVVGISGVPSSAPGVPHPMPAPDPVAATKVKAE